ncbi:hypothetical protein D9M72_577990 [compost metagenome]
MAVDDAVDLVGAGGGLIDPLREGGHGLFRAGEQRIEVQHVLHAELAGAGHGGRVGAIDVGRLQRLVQSGSTCGDEGRIGMAFARQVAEQAIEQPHISTGTNRQVQVGQLASGGAARVDRHDLHLGACFLGLGQALEQDRVAPRGIGTHQHHQVGQFQVFIAARHQVFAKGALVAGNRR